MKKLRYWLLCLVLAAVGSLVIRVPSVLAANASLYLSPSSRSLTQGSSIYIAVRVSPNGNAVNAVQANLTYPTDKFDYLSASCSSSFSITAQASGGGGSVKLGCGQIGGGVTTDTQIGTVVLRAKVSSGSGAVTFASGSNIASNGNNVTGGLSGATYTFAAAPVAAPKDTTPPKISSVAVSDISYHAATVTWTTDEASSSVVEFGLTDSLGLTAQSEGTATAHKVSLPANQLVPGTKYRYRVKSVDGAGNTATSDLADLTITGITVQVKAVNTKQKPLVGANVTFIIEDQSVRTVKDGIATFSNQVPGKRSLSVSFNGVTVAQAIDIKDNADPAAFAQENLGTQTFTVVLPTKSGLSLWLIILIGLGGLLAGAALAFGAYRLFLILMKKRQEHKKQKALMVVETEHKNESEPQPEPSQAPALPLSPAEPEPRVEVEPPPEVLPLVPIETTSSVTDLGPQPAVAITQPISTPAPQPQRRFLDVARGRPTPRPVIAPLPPRVTPPPAAVPPASPADVPPTEPYILKETPPPTIAIPVTTAAPAPEPASTPAPSPVVTASTPAPEPAPTVNPLPVMAKPEPVAAAPVSPPEVPKPASANPAPAPAVPLDTARLAKEGFTIAPAPQVIHPERYRAPDE